MELHPYYRQQWSGEDGYVDSDELIGYMVVGSHGKTLGYGESESDALEAAYEAMWQESSESEGGLSAGMVATR